MRKKANVLFVGILLVFIHPRIALHPSLRSGSPVLTVNEKRGAKGESVNLYLIPARNSHFTRQTSTSARKVECARSSHLHLRGGCDQQRSNSHSSYSEYDSEARGASVERDSIEWSEGEEVEAQSGADQPLPNIIRQDPDRPPEVNEGGWTDAPCRDVNELILLEDGGMTVRPCPIPHSLSVFVSISPLS